MKGHIDVHIKMYASSKCFMYFLSKLLFVFSVIQKQHHHHPHQQVQHKNIDNLYLRAIYVISKTFQGYFWLIMCFTLCTATTATQ